jgi:uncharacterized spore protein YtfJ
MSRKEMIDSAVAHLRTRAEMKTVYGEPVVINGKTVIPVAKITLGAAGAGGAGGAGLKQREPHDASEREPVAAATGNGTASVAARPVGVVEISDHKTRFVAFGQTKRLAIAAVAGSGLGVVLGWMLGRRNGKGA